MKSDLISASLEQQICYKPQHKPLNFYSNACSAIAGNNNANRIFLLYSNKKLLAPKGKEFLLALFTFDRRANGY